MSLCWWVHSLPWLLMCHMHTLTHHLLVVDICSDLSLTSMFNELRDTTMIYSWWVFLVIWRCLCSCHGLAYCSILRVSLFDRIFIVRVSWALLASKTHRVTSCLLASSLLDRVRMQSLLLLQLFIFATVHAIRVTELRILLIAPSLCRVDHDVLVRVAWHIAAIHCYILSTPIIDRINCHFSLEVSFRLKLWRLLFVRSLILLIAACEQISRLPTISIHVWRRLVLAWGAKPSSGILLRLHVLVVSTFGWVWVEWVNYMGVWLVVCTPEKVR